MSMQKLLVVPLSDARLFVYILDMFNLNAVLNEEENPCEYAISFV